jgi:Ala-tRNA(Pro) deacylase
MTKEPPKFPKTAIFMDIYDFLSTHGVEYERYDHPPVFTCEEADRLVPEMDAAETKNLFVRDRKGNRHFLVVVGYDKQVDLNALSKSIGSTRLSLGSAERLATHLGVQPGSVTILALANDRHHKVELYLDEPIAQATAVRCHPLVNTATLLIQRPALEKFLEATGHELKIVDVPSRST